jgi:hypothetical protein
MRTSVESLQAQRSACLNAEQVQDVEPSVQPRVIAAVLVLPPTKREAGMKAMMVAAAAAAVIAQAPASAAPRDRFCIDLDRVLRTAELGGDFVGMQRQRSAPPRLGFGHCFPAAGRLPSWYCHQTMAPDGLGLDRLAASTAACRPEAKREPSSGDEAVFTLPYARIRIREDGGPRAHVGRIASYRVEALVR